MRVLGKRRRKFLKPYNENRLLMKPRDLIVNGLEDPNFIFELIKINSKITSRHGFNRGDNFIKL